MSITTTSNIDVAVRTQLEYYGAGRYDLADQFVTADFVEHEAPATGRQFEIEAIHLYRLENGRVAEHWAKRDDVALAKQLGLFE